MQFSILTLFTLVAAVMAIADDHVKRQDSQDGQDSQVDVEKAAMTDKNGNIIAFDANGVNKASEEAGL